VKSPNLAELADEEKIKLLKQSTWLQSGTNKFASQKGQTGTRKYHLNHDHNYNIIDE
jgi:hypothetical protein